MAIGLTITVNVLTAIIPLGPFQTIESQVGQPGTIFFAGAQPCGGVNVNNTGPPQDGLDGEVTGFDVINPGTVGIGVPGTVNDITAPNAPGDPNPPVTISLEAK